MRSSAWSHIEAAYGIHVLPVPVDVTECVPLDESHHIPRLCFFVFLPFLIVCYSELTHHYFNIRRTNIMTHIISQSHFSLAYRKSSASFAPLSTSQYRSMQYHTHQQDDKILEFTRPIPYKTAAIKDPLKIQSGFNTLPPN